jgi:hypothetical protein
MIFPDTEEIMVLNFIAIALVIALLVPGSMLSAFDSPTRTQRIARLPVKQASLTEARVVVQKFAPFSWRVR